MSTELLAGEVTRAVIACFCRVYDRLGYGFLESVYRRALWHELRKDGQPVETERAMDVWYDGVRVGRLRADLVVDGRVIVEVKSAATLGPADRKQLLNYLRASDINVGLLLHFGPSPAFHRLVYSDAARRRLNADERGHDAD